MAQNVEQSSKLKVGAKDVDFFIERLAEIIIKQMELSHEESEKDTLSQAVKKSDYE